MTDGASSIWREDEGQAAGGRAGQPDHPTSLFERTAPQEPDSQRRDSLDLWRPDEGRPNREVRRSPTPALPLAPAPPPPPAPSRSERRGTEKRTRFRWRALSGATLALFSLALIVDGALALMTIRDQLGGVAAELKEVEQRLTTGDVRAATESAEEALGQARSAQAATNRPGLMVAALIPEARREVEAVRGAVAAAELSAQAGRSVVSGASKLGLDNDGVPSDVYVDGEVQLKTLADAREDIDTAELSLRVARSRLETLQPRLEQLQGPIEEARLTIDSTLQRVTDARTLMGLVPSLFGDLGERRYLLAFQAPGEARGTGGVVGLAAVLEANEGRLELGKPAPYQDFAPVSSRDVDAPAWFAKSYGPQQALSHWPQANVSPNHRVVSKVLLEMYEQATAERLHGVMTMDPLALQELMMGADPIQVRRPSTLIDASNVAEVLLHDSYTEFETPQEQNRFLAEVVDDFWSQVTDGRIDLKLFAEGLGNAIREQHFKLYMRPRADQRKIERLGVDGNYDVGPNTQMVFNVNYAVNKVDYFLHRHFDTEIELGPDGEAQVTTTMRVENRAPSEPASALLGQENGLDPGVNRMTINVLMPPGSEIDSLSVGGGQREPFTYLDQDSPVVWDVLEIPPGGTETVSVTYSMREALRPGGEASTFDFSLYPQATINPDTFSISISPAPGMEVVRTKGGLSANETPALSGTLDEPLVLGVVIENVR